MNRGFFMSRTIRRFTFACTVAAVVFAPAMSASADVAGTPTSVSVNEAGDLVIDDWVGTEDLAGNSLDLVVDGKVVRSSEPIAAGRGCESTKPDRDHAYAVKCASYKSGFVWANLDDGSDVADIEAKNGAYVVGGASADDIIVRSRGPVTVFGDMDRNAPIADWDYPLGDDLIVIVGSGDAEVHGSTGGDEIWGGNGDDLLCGEDDGDEVHGGNGDDRVYGDACLDAEGRSDVPSGSGMMDWVEGGKGKDVLSGGPGDYDTVSYPGGGETVKVSYDNRFNDGRKLGGENDNVTDAEWVSTM
jgi:Ca2+-binding RTX toxin-like protein